MNTKIKLIDVFGQFEDQGTDHYYTFLPLGEAPTGWRTVMKDPRNEVNANLQQCYVTWCTATDWWIAKMIKNPHDSRGGFAMLSICLGANRPLDGGGAVKVLDSFAQFFIVEKHWTDADAEKALMNQEENLLLVPSVLRKFVEPTASINSAYRNYDSKEQLEWYLSFLPQPGYEEFSRIFFVPKDESEGMPVKCLDERLPLKKIYSIHYPEECSSPSGKKEIMDGEDLIIRYNKYGLEPVERVIKGGVDSECAFVYGTEMQIRPEKEVAGLIHDRVITIKCQDSDGRSIERFRLSNYTRQHSDIRINENQVILPENFSELAVVEVIPTDDRYETEKVNLGKEDTINVKLKPKDYKVVFRMGNEEFETNKTMNPSLARTRWSGFESEVDNDKKTIYFRTYGKPSEKHHETIHTKVENSPFFERFPWLRYVIIGLLALLFGYGIYAGVSKWGFKKSPWPFGKKIEVKTDVENGEASQGAVQPTPEEFNPVADSVFVIRKHDIDYLTREKKLWTKDSIQSKDYQEIYDNLAQGEVENVISQYDHLFGESNITNDTFKLIVEDMKILVGTGDQTIQKQVSDEMKRLSKGGFIKLDELLTSVNLIVKRNQQGVTNSKPANGTATPSNPQNGQKKPNSDEA